ncbi:hypothetical protein Tco_1156320 [Tanacetum coccineum]
MDNVKPRGSCSPNKRSYYTKPAFRPKDLKQDVKTFGVKNMTTAGTRAVVNTGKGKMGNPEIVLQDHAVVDSGYSSHMTGNKAYLSDYENFNGGFVAFGSSPGKETEPSQEYFLLPIHPHRPKISVGDVVQDTQDKPSENTPKNNEVQDSEDVAKKEEQHKLREAEQALQDELEKMISQELAAKAMNDDSRQAFEEEKRRMASQKRQLRLPAICTIPIDASTLPNVDLPIDPNMPDLEDASETLPNDGIFNRAYDDNEDAGAVADINNRDNSIAVSLIPTLRIHKDHPKGHILGDPSSAVQTRGKIHKAS